MTISAVAISLPVILFTRLYPTGSIDRRSSQSKSMPELTVAEYKPTGIWTRPKLIAPFQRVRVEVGALPCPCFAPDERASLAVGSLDRMCKRYP